MDAEATRVTRGRSWNRLSYFMFSEAWIWISNFEHQIAQDTHPAISTAIGRCVFDWSECFCKRPSSFNIHPNIYSYPWKSLSSKFLLSLQWVKPTGFQSGINSSIFHGTWMLNKRSCPNFHFSNFQPFKDFKIEPLLATFEQLNLEQILARTMV